jgi:hypothetical protein
MKLLPKARVLLRSAVRHHPNLPNLIDSQDAVFRMSNERLAELAEDLGLDIPFVISETEKVLPGTPSMTVADVELQNYSERAPAYGGELGFELKLRFKRKSVT